jgi:uncharacterized repeat protein (TIGR01451 family)
MLCFAPVQFYEDGVLFRQDSIQLNAGDSAVFRIAGDGHTIRVEVSQHPLHPGSSKPSSTVELCGDPMNWTSGLVNIYPQDDADPTLDIYCGVVTGSYDPNDKTGFPLGVGGDHEILPGQALDYRIRFQNTGTDTAFTVVIRDTLPEELDIYSVRLTNASHNYRFRTYGPRVLEWTFNNIMLPDSNVNEPLSHGFVNFKVQQAPNLPLGTQIENSAAIYFDFNAPIITNTSIHTVQIPTVYVGTPTLLEEAMNIKVYPNPTENFLTVEQGNDQLIQLSLRDNLGRVVVQQQVAQKSTVLDLAKLPAGVYFLQMDNGKQRSTKKIIKR